MWKSEEGREGENRGWVGDTLSLASLRWRVPVYLGHLSVCVCPWESVCLGLLSVYLRFPQPHGSTGNHPKGDHKGKCSCRWQNLDISLSGWYESEEETRAENSYSVCLLCSWLLAIHVHLYVAHFCPCSWWIWLLVVSWVTAGTSCPQKQFYAPGEKGTNWILDMYLSPTSAYGTTLGCCSLGVGV